MPYTPLPEPTPTLIPLQIWIAPPHNAIKVPLASSDLSGPSDVQCLKARFSDSHPPQSPLSFGTAPVLPPAVHYSAATTGPLQCCHQLPTTVLPPPAHCSAAANCPLQYCHRRPTAVLPPPAHCSAATNCPLQCCRQRSTAVLPPASH